MTAPVREEIQIKCFTWNVGNAEPREDELHHWLPDADSNKYDLVVVGTQENSFKVSGKGGDAAGVAREIEEDTGPRESRATLPLSADSQPSVLQHQNTEMVLPVNTPQAVREKDAQLWDGMVARRLGAGYACIKHIVLWEMRLSVYAKSAHVTGASRCISSVGFATSATGGPGGLMGNKGGLIVKLTFRGTTFAFISCHLAAHSHMLAKRNENCQEVLRETSRLGSPYLDAASQASRTAPATARATARTKGARDGARPRTLRGPLGRPAAPPSSATAHPSSADGRAPRAPRRRPFTPRAPLTATHTHTHPTPRGACPCAQFDHVFWLGDLNYRVDLNAGLPAPAYADDAAHHAAVSELVTQGAWAELLKADQLNVSATDCH